MKKAALIFAFSTSLFFSPVWGKNNPNENFIQYDIETTIDGTELVITISGTINDEISLSFMDIRGEESFHENLENIEGSYRKVINIEDFKKGVYFFKVDAGDEIRLKKIAL